MLDECIPRPLRRELPDHEVRTVQEQGWDGQENGELLRLAAAAGFDVFLTADRGIEFQQQVPALGLAVVALRARSNDVNDLRPPMAAVRNAIAAVRPGTIVRVPA